MEIFGFGAWQVIKDSYINVPQKVNFIGLLVDIITYNEMAAAIDTWLLEKNSRSHHIACVNVNCCVEALIDKRLNRLFNKADIVGPDGMPFIYWIRWALRKNCDRIYAPDVILELCKRAAVKEYSFYLYGGDTGVANDMREHLLKKFPGIKIVGTRTPPFRNLTEQEDAAICTEINMLKPDIVLVGLGSPKQDVWIQEHLDKIKGCVMISSGAAFDFFSGRIKQAPHIIQKSGFEWLFRFFQDPKRLWKRYTYYNFLFVLNFVYQIFKIKKY